MPRSLKPINDHIFGDLDLPENAAPWLLERTRGVHHYHNKAPLNLIPGSSLTIYAVTSDDLPFDEAVLYYSINGWKSYEQLSMSKAEKIWGSLRWGWLQTWHLTLPPQDEGTLLHYKIGAHTAGRSGMVFADNQAVSLEDATNFTVWYAHNKVPAWAQDAIIYQVFVDRFNPGSGKDWDQTSDLSKPMGGTLRGITEKLGHLQEMGFNTLWLTPIFDSPSHHGYDTSDYFKINPRFGSLADFDELVEKAHRLGMRILLDFVANHCSNQHPAFQGAVEDPASTYHDWFTWQPWPEYKCFYNVPEMPELDLRFGKPARQYLLDLAQYWLRRGVDGYRLDYAHGPAQDFWVEFQRACRQVNPECWTFGEIVQPADVQARFAGGINGSLDFLTCQALRLAFAQQTWSLSRFAGFLTAQQDYYPKDFNLPAFFDNHDMNRFYFSAHENLQLLQMVLNVLYFLPGPPIVYYGTEVPLSQRRSIHAGGALGFDEARLPMVWYEPQSPILEELLKRLAQIREHQALAVPSPISVLHMDDDQQTLLLERGTDECTTLLALNRSTKSKKIGLVLASNDCLQDLISGERIASNGSTLIIDLEPFSCRLLSASAVNRA